MRKALIIAHREYKAIVGTKAFLLVITIMPILMFGGIAAQSFMQRQVMVDAKRIVVVDATGVLAEAFTKAAEARNTNEITDLKTGKRIKPRYLVETLKGQADESLRLTLSERIRRHEIDAFLEIPAQAAQSLQGEPPRILFHAENAALSEERNWAQNVLNEALRVRRLQAAGIDPGVVARASMPLAVAPAGPVERSSNGQVTQPEQRGMEASILLPFGIMMLMFMVIFLSSQPMLESVLEEKSQRIAEVLLGSANPFELMLGKLLGGVGGSLTVVAIYATGASAVAWHYGVLEWIPLRIIPWFLVYQVLAVLLFGSVFMAVGSAANQLKEAQGLLLPVWLVTMFPLFVWMQVVREPSSSFATWMSFIPPGTPLLMVLRLAASSSVPLWQPALGIVIMLAATLLVVLAAARVFRIAILAQGKTPSLAELLRWAISG